jgi:hypothetical protein
VRTRKTYLGNLQLLSQEEKSEKCNRMLQYNIRKKLKTSKHEKTESVFSEWLRVANSRSNVETEL